MSDQQHSECAGEGEGLEEEVKVVAAKENEETAAAALESLVKNGNNNNNNNNCDNKATVLPALCVVVFSVTRSSYSKVVVTQSVCLIMLSCADRLRTRRSRARAATIQSYICQRLTRSSGHSLSQSQC